jgi:hypothetical protein
MELTHQLCTTHVPQRLALRRRACASLDVARVSSMHAAAPSAPSSTTPLRRLRTLFPPPCAERMRTWSM